jgi:hypothetical protein
VPSLVSLTTVTDPLKHSLLVWRIGTCHRSHESAGCYEVPQNSSPESLCCLCAVGPASPLGPKQQHPVLEL